MWLRENVGDFANIGQVEYARSENAAAKTASGNF